MRIKGNKTVNELAGDVRAGILQLGELPSGVRDAVAARVAELEEAAAKAAKEAEKAAKPKKGSKKSG